MSHFLSYHRSLTILLVRTDHRLVHLRLWHSASTASTVVMFICNRYFISENLDLCLKDLNDRKLQIEFPKP